MIQEDEILAIVNAEINDSIFHYDTSFKGDRIKALEYYQGILTDLPAPQGWSQFVSSDVADTINLVLPGLLRIFDGANHIVVYTPDKKEDEGQDLQATDYVNYVWKSETDGYRALFAAIFDALLFRNGILKVYWDMSEKFESEKMSGLSDEQLTMLLQDETIEVLSHGDRQEYIEAIDPQTGMVGTQSIQVHDIKIKRSVQKGRLIVKCIPPESFLKDRQSTDLETARFVAHREMKRRSDLIADGFDREKVDAIPAYSDGFDNILKEQREDQYMDYISSSTSDTSLQELEVFECYPLIDMDGDGIAERYKIVVAGTIGSRNILHIESCSDDHPFQDIKAMIEPHRWQGRSIADSTKDIMRVKTALLRSALDNIYQVNKPQRIVIESDIINPDELLNPEIGGVIRVRRAGAITDLVVPFIGDKAMSGLDYMDKIIQKRTGISGATAALDETALVPQTATAEQISHDASYAQTELMARNIAESGLKKLFRKILRLVVKNQDRRRTIKMRGKWVDFDPRGWNANMGTEINIGLGTGSRERDLGMLRAIGQEQDKIIAQLGVDNPIVTPEMYVKTRHKMIESGGLPNPDLFFANISPQEYQQWQQQQDAKKLQDPKVLEVQMKEKLQMQEIASNKAKNEMDEERIRAKLEADTSLAKQRLDSEREIHVIKLKFEQEKHQMQLEHDIRVQDIKHEHERGVHGIGMMERAITIKDKSDN